MIGVHPFYINLERTPNNQTNAHGQFFFNSNAMDVDLQPLPALTYTTIGGIIDLYIFTGPTVENVIGQYWDIIGVSVGSCYDTFLLFILETYDACILVTWVSSLSLWIRYYAKFISYYSSKILISTTNENFLSHFE